MTKTTAIHTKIKTRGYFSATAVQHNYVAHKSLYTILENKTRSYMYILYSRNAIFLKLKRKKIKSTSLVWRAEGLHTRVCVSNIIMVAVVSEKKYICRKARFNALGARYAIIKFKQGDDFIFPQTIYYILYVFVRVYKYILFKRSETVEMPSATPRPIEQRRGKLSLEFFLTSATPLAVVKLELVGGGWLWR